MSQNPYQPPTVTPSSSTRRPSFSAHGLCSAVGSIVLVLLGIAVAGLGMLPSDAPGFFLLTGAHLIASGTLAVTCAWVNGRGEVRNPLCWMSIVVNAALMIWIAILILNSTVRGPLIVAAPLLLGIPAVLNVVSAVLNLRRGWRQGA
jgi:hypothetical protein